jgi:hypothetical protein
MGKTRSPSSKSSSDEALPAWAEEEIKSVPLEEQEAITRTGYILDIYDKDFKIDIQLYESLPDGRTIIENLDVPRSIDIGSFMKGFVYEFKIKVFAGLLSTKVVELLKIKFSSLNYSICSLWTLNQINRQLRYLHHLRKNMKKTSDYDEKDGDLNIGSGVPR